MLSTSNRSQSGQNRKPKIDRKTLNFININFKLFSSLQVTPWIAFLSVKVDSNIQWC